MPVLMPTAEDLLPMTPPSTIALIFAQFQREVKDPFPWNAFLVTTATERERIYKSGGLPPEEQQLFEDALTNDQRKIRVRRDAWTKTINEAIRQFSFLSNDQSDSDDDSSNAAQASSDSSEDSQPTTTSTTVKRGVEPLLPPNSLWPTRPGDRPYSGIVNGGNTCYLNSVLQVLFHLPVFRQHVYGIEEPPLTVDEEGNIPSVCSALKALFMELDLGNKRVDTKRLTDSFGWNDEEAGRQHDVLELLQKLFESVETQFSRTAAPSFLQVALADESSLCSTQKFIDALFGGAFTYSTRATDDSGNVSRRSENFLELQLTVKDNLSLEDSLKQLTAVEEVDGKIAWEKEDGTKTYHPVERSMKISKLPHVLLVHPQRVDFDLVRLQRVTITTRWEFPLTLNMRDFVVSNGETETENEEDCVYELRSLILHSGSAHFGHYVTCVRVAEASWWSFNDQSVWSESQSDILERAFGGSRSVRSDVRASLLCYVRRTKLTDVLTELPTTDEMVRDVAAFHTRYQPEVKMHYHVLDGEFAKRIGNRDVPEAKSITVPENATVSLVLQRLLAEEHVTSESHIVMLWRYKYLPQDEERDVAVRILTEEQMASYPESALSNCMSHPIDWSRRNFVLQLLDRGVASRFLAEDTAEAPLTKFILVRYWKEGFIQFFGTVSSHEHLPHVANLLYGNQSEDVETKSTRAVMRHTDPFLEPDESDSDDNEEEEENRLVKPVQQQASENTPFDAFVCVGHTNPIRIIIRPQFLSSGANLVITPKNVTVRQIAKVLEEKFVTVSVRWIQSTNISQSVELISLTLDEHTKYSAIQQAIFDALPSEAAALLPEMPDNPSRIGLHMHHVESDSAKRSLSRPTTSKSGFHSYSHSTTLKDLTCAGIHHFPVNVIHFEVLPAAVPADGFAHFTQFIINLRENLRAYVYIYRCASRAAADVLEDCFGQAKIIFGEDAMRDLSAKNFRLVGLDYYGRLCRTLEYDDDLVVVSSGTYVSTWTVDLLDSVVSPPLEVVPTLTADAVAEGETLPANEPHLRLNVECIKKSNLLDDYVNLPTNVVVYPSTDTGATVLGRISRKLGIVEGSEREKEMSLAKLVVRGSTRRNVEPSEAWKSVLEAVPSPLGLYLDFSSSSTSASDNGKVSSATREYGISIRAQRSLQQPKEAK